MDSNLVDLFIIKQSAKGAVPDAAMSQVRMTGESFTGKRNRKISDEIRADGQVTDVTELSAEQNGGFEFDLAASKASGTPAQDTVMNDLLKAVMLSSAWSTPAAAIAALADLIVDADAGTVTTTAGTFNTLTVGKCVKISGFTDQSAGAGVDATGNNGIYRITARGTKVITLSPKPPVAVATAQDTVTITDSAHIVNGLAAPNPDLFTIERKHKLTGGDKFFAYRDCACTGLSLQVQAEAEVTGNFQFMGGEELADSAASVCDGNTPIAPNTNPVFNATNNVARVIENGEIQTGMFFQEITLNVGRNPRRIPAIGKKWGAAIGFGEWAISGTMSVLFTDKALYNKYVNNTATSIMVVLTDAAGNSYAINMGRCKFLDGSLNVSGKNQDLPLSLNFQALRDTTLDQTIQIDFFAAA